MIYYRVENEWEAKYIKKAEEITTTKYKSESDLISVDCIWSIIENLVDTIEHEREEKEKEIQAMYEKEKEKWNEYEYGE